MVLDRSRGSIKRLDGSRTRSRNSFTLDYSVATPLAFDLDVRKLVDEIRINLAEHYSLSLLAGRLADGSGSLPPLSRATQAIHPDRASGSFGVRSGDMARRWLIYPVRGSSVRATTRLKPYGADGRSDRINGWLVRGIDLQSIQGEAAEVIRRTIDTWMRAAHGKTVSTPRKATTRGGELPGLK